ncbi:hypothetical protein AAG570_008334, partial [Ranatra chinensis]
LEGLNSGVPTRTTATLTPTTLRNIETFIEIQCQVESHHNQAGFVPPVVQPSNQGVFMSVDTKSWQGGSTRVSEPTNISAEVTKHSLPQNTPQPRRNVGGRRPNKDKSISPEEEEKRQVRRERNKIAAARCRKRRLDHTNELIQETSGLEGKRQDLQKEIQKLQRQKEELEFFLDAHKRCCRLLAPDSPPDIKPLIDDKMDIITPESENTTTPPSEKIKSRPTTLPVPPAFTQPLPTEIGGVPITTPTAGMPFNFESLMEGGTGLTPVSAPLIPSCSSQQRSNSGCVDLSSPDSGKLVSL